MDKLFLALLLVSATLVSAQKAVLINENFQNKGEDKKEGWSDFDIATTVAGKEAKFTGKMIKYWSKFNPAKPCDCTRAVVNIEMTKNDFTSALEFPELPSCGVLKIGIQANGKDCKRGFVLQKQDKTGWVIVDQIDLDSPPIGTCTMWMPKNATSKTPVKFRLIGTKTGNVFVSDVYAEAY
jgi:hypothetical protein